MSPQARSTCAAEPSTEAEVLGKLGAGRGGTRAGSAIDADWARILIEGDGVEGYVALRYCADAP